MTDNNIFYGGFDLDGKWHPNSSLTTSTFEQIDRNIENGFICIHHKIPHKCKLCIRSDLPRTRIVCAAIRGADGQIVTSARHYDKNMLNQIEMMQNPDNFYHRSREDQGFIDQFGNYYTRQEAYTIAYRNEQIHREVNTSSENTLFSEHLY